MMIGLAASIAIVVFLVCIVFTVYAFTDYSSPHRFVVGCVRLRGPLFRLGKGSGRQHQRSSSRSQDHSSSQRGDE